MDNGLESSDSSIARAANPLDTSESTEIFKASKKSLFEKFDYIDKTNNEYPYCIICDFYRLPADEINVHVTSKRHVAAFKRHGCDGIMSIESARYLCVYCDRRLSNRKKIYYHITTKKHLKMVSAKGSSKGKLNRVMEIPKNEETKDELTSCIGISKRSGNYYFCHLCRDPGIFLQLKDVNNHVTGNRHRTSLLNYACDKIIFTENLHGEDYYYCKICDSEFPNRKIGVHVRSPEHSRIESDIKEMEPPRILNNLKTSNIVIENSSITQENSIKSINSNESNSEINLVVKAKIEENSEINDDDVETEFHRCLFTSFFDEKTYFYSCFICVTKSNTVYSVFGNNKDKLLTAHIRGEKHGAMIVKFGCDKIVAKGKKYYCETCSIKIKSKKRVYFHIKSVKHLELTRTIVNDRMSFGVTPKDLFIYVIKQNSTWIADTYYCWICDDDDDDYSVSQKDLKLHLASKLHKDSLKKYACHEITRRCDNYYCKRCEIEFDDMKKLFFHVKNENHINRKSVVVPHGQSLINNFTVDEKKDSQPETSELEIKGNSNINKKDEITSCIGISKRDEKSYSCYLCCNPVTFLQLKDVNIHVAGKRHRSFLLYYACDKIIFTDSLHGEDYYYCKICDSEFPNREIGIHVRSPEHSRIKGEIKKLEPSKMFNNLKTSSIVIENSSITRENSVKSIDSKESNSHEINLGVKIKIDENLEINDNDVETEFHRRVFTSFFGRRKLNFHTCLICITKFDTNYMVYGKNKDKLLSAHIRGELHGATIAKFGCDKIVVRGKKYYCETCSTEMTGMKQIRKHIQSENHLRLIKMFLIDRMSFDVASDDLFIYAIKQNSNWIADTYYCWVCDEDGSHVPQKVLKTHLTSKLHKDSLKKYACQHITRRYDRYYCNCCEIEFNDMKNVFFHVKEENHRKQKSIVLPHNKNMISNFTLEEENYSQPEAKELETEESTKILIDDGDLDLERELRYISSDPEILCRGIIPKSLQKYAIKLKKQQLNNPYCLICNFEIPGYSAIDDHIKGKIHTDSLLRNGCDKILQRINYNTQRFSCGWCTDLELQTIEGIYRHIRTETHLSKIRKARPELFESRRKKAKEERKENSFLAPQNFTELYELQSSNIDSGVIVNEANNEEPLNFNSIFSSISDDLSRMLSHLEVSSQAKGANKELRVETKNGKIEKKKKKRFAETSPDRDGGFVCSVCQATFPRKAELHSHMAVHFGQEFGYVVSDAENSTDDEENSKIVEKDAKIDEENAKDSDESFREIIFR